MQTFERCCQVLGVTPGTPLELAKKKYWQRARATAVDLDPSRNPEEHKEVNLAWEAYQKYWKAGYRESQISSTFFKEHKAVFTGEIKYPEPKSDPLIPEVHVPTVVPDYKVVNVFIGKGGNGKSTRTGEFTFASAMITGHELYAAGVVPKDSDANLRVVCLAGDIGHEGKMQRFFKPIFGIKNKMKEHMTTTELLSFVSSRQAAIDAVGASYAEKLKTHLVLTDYILSNTRVKYLPLKDPGDLDLEEVIRTFSSPDDFRGAPKDSRISSVRIKNQGNVNLDIPQYILTLVDFFDNIRAEELLLPVWIDYKDENVKRYLHPFWRDGRLFAQISHIGGSSEVNLYKPQIQHTIDDLLDLPINVLNIDCGPNADDPTINLILAAHGKPNVIHRIFPVIGRDKDVGKDDQSDTIKAIIYKKLCNHFESELEITQNQVMKMKTLLRQLHIHNYEQNATAKQKRYLDEKLSLLRLLQRGLEKQLSYLAVLDEWNSKKKDTDAPEELLKFLDYKISKAERIAMNSETIREKYRQNQDDLISFKKTVTDILSTINIYPIVSVDDYPSSFLQELSAISKWNSMFGLKLVPQGYYILHDKEIKDCFDTGTFYLIDNPRSEPSKNLIKIVRSIELGEDINFKRYDLPYGWVKENCSRYGFASMPDSFYRRYSSDMPYDPQPVQMRAPPQPVQLPPKSSLWGWIFDKVKGKK